MGFRPFGQPFGSGFGQPLGQPGGGSNPNAGYTLYDRFSAALAAGSVNGTFADTGQLRTVVDTNSKLQVINNVASFATGGVGSGDPGLWYPLEARVAGKTLLANLVQSAVACQVGWAMVQTSTIDTCLRPITGTNVGVRDNGTQIAVSADAGATLQTALILRSAGAFYFVKSSVYSNWTLVWVSANGVAGMYPGAQAATNTSVFTADNIRIPVVLYMPSPLAYDTFTRSNGALGSTEAAGPDSQVITPIAWGTPIGTWAIATNKAAATALAGGVAIATIAVPSKDNFIEAALTRAGGLAGVVGRYTDASNYIYAYHDGTNAGIKQRLAGVETDLIAATAATYAANAVIRLVMDGNSAMLFYNGARVGATGTINAGLSGAVDGLYTTDTGNTFDLVTSWARGNTGTEYSMLDAA